MHKFTRYANLTREDREGIFRAFRFHRLMSNSVGHAVSCVTNDFFQLTSRQWNGKMGADAFAATLAVLVMENAISITDTAKE